MESIRCPAINMNNYTRIIIDHYKFIGIVIHCCPIRTLNDSMFFIKAKFYARQFVPAWLNTKSGVTIDSRYGQPSSPAVRILNLKIFPNDITSRIVLDLFVIATYHPVVVVISNLSSSFCIHKSTLLVKTCAYSGDHSCVYTRKIFILRRVIYIHTKYCESFRCTVNVFMFSRTMRDI